MDRDKSTQPSRVVLTHWAAFGVPAVEQRLLMQKLLLLTLVYDEVLIQDDWLVVDNDLARLFAGHSFRKLENLVATGAIRVLSRPGASYPTESLRKQAERNTIQARSQQIEDYSTKGPVAFVPTRQQIGFHRQLDGLLARSGRGIVFHPSVSRPALAMDFQVLLHGVLSERAPWVARTYRIPQEVVDRYRELVEDPQGAVDRLRLASRHPRFEMGLDDRPVMLRSLAYQIANLFPDEARKFQSLVQSVFAATLTWAVGAVGTYGRRLRELVITEGPEPESVVGVEARVQLQGALPLDTSDFGEAVANVRSSPEGVRLRESMSRLGQEFGFAGFAEQEDAWRAVASALHDQLYRIRPIGITAIAGGTGAGLAGGVIAHIAAGKGQDWLHQLPLELEGELLAGGMVAGGALVYSLMSKYLPSREVLSQLERSLTFRCTDIPRPRVLVSPGLGNP